MKRKYHGMIVIGISAITLGAIGAYLASGLWKGAGTNQRVSRPGAFHIKVPTAEQVRQMEQLYDRLPWLASPEKRTVAAMPLSLFGYQEDAIKTSGERESDHDGLDPDQYHLSLIVLAGLNNYCIVDGDFLMQGARMEDGTEVVKIESHRVLVSRNQERRWIYLQDEPAPSASTNPMGTAGLKKGQS